MNKKPSNSKEIKQEVEIQHDALEVSYVEDNQINLLPLLREIIQLNQPIQPKCQEKGGGPEAPKCIADWDYKSYFEESTNPLSPFSSLKGLKVEKKVDNKQEKGQFTKSKKNSR